MTKIKPDDLMGAILETIHDQFLGGDEDVKPVEKQFITWCSPGFAFTEDYFDFASIGSAAAKDAESAAQMNQNEYDFSSIVNFIPDINSFYDSATKQLMYSSDGRRLSAIYDDILKHAVVAKQELSAEQEEKIKKAQEILGPIEKEVTDEFGDKKMEISQTNYIKRFNKYQTEYNEARRMYQEKRNNLMRATGKEGKAAVDDWKQNGILYLNQVRIAEEQWEAEGKKNIVDKARAYISQTTGRSLTLWLQNLIRRTKDLDLTSAAGAIYKPAFPSPSNFAKSSGWTNFFFSYESAIKINSKSKSEWGVNVEGSAGGFKGFLKKLSPLKVNTKVTGSKEVSIDDVDIEDFDISFEITQVVINRPWFYPSFFANRGWTLDAEQWNLQHNGEVPSDGGFPPKGNFIAYPMKMILIRNLSLKSQELEHKITNIKKESDVATSTKIGWGPFSLSPKVRVKKSSDSTTDDKEETIGELKVDGMQVIGFINQLIPKAPNPKKDLNYPEDFEL